MKTISMYASASPPLNMGGGRNMCVCVCVCAPAATVAECSELCGLSCRPCQAAQLFCGLPRPGQGSVCVRMHLPVD